MNEFLVELYVSKTNGGAAADRWHRLRRAAAEVTAEGRPVRLVRSIFVPEDETCFLLFKAEAADAVRETARRGGVACERIAEAAIDLTESPAPPLDSESAS